MARTTRSQKLADGTSNGLATSHPPPSSSKPKSPTRKRKRMSLASPEDQPAIKQARNGDVTDSHAANEQVQPPEDSANSISTHPKGAGDIPLEPQIAQRILDILEMLVPCFFLRHIVNNVLNCCGAGLTLRVFLIVSFPSPQIPLAPQLLLAHKVILFVLS